MVLASFLRNEIIFGEVEDMNICWRKYLDSIAACMGWTVRRWSLTGQPKLLVHTPSRIDAVVTKMNESGRRMHQAQASEK